MSRRLTSLLIILIGLSPLTVPQEAPGGEVSFEVHWKRPAAALGYQPGSKRPQPPEGEAQTGTSGGSVRGDTYFHLDTIQPTSCSLCHPVQYKEWSGSLHSRSYSPGMAGQFDGTAQPAYAKSCYGCHTPLVEQGEMVWIDQSEMVGLDQSDMIEIDQSEMAEKEDGEFIENKNFSQQLQATGVNCAACHLRDDIIYGPTNPLTTPKRIDKAGPGGLHDSIQADFFSSAEFCSACHQLDGGYSLNGKVLTNTYREWENSRYGETNITCQFCHMPDRKHLFKGIHDKEMVLQGVSIKTENTTAGDGSKDGYSATLEVINTGVGHMFPTYVTPIVVLKGYLTDKEGSRVEGTKQEEYIGRYVTVDLREELFDTRLAPSASTKFRYNMTVEALGELKLTESEREGIKGLTLEIWVYPDEFYNRFFKTYQKYDLPPDRKGKIDEALRRTEESPYLLFEERYNFP